MKVAPENPGGLQVPHQEKTVYNQIDERADDSRVERLLPPPEAPQPVPVFPPATSGGAAAGATGAASPTVKDAPAGAAPGAAASNGATASKEPPLPSPGLAKPPQPPTIANPPQPEPSKKTESAEKPSSVEKETVKKEAKAEPSKNAAVTKRQGYKVDRKSTSLNSSH